MQIRAPILFLSGSVDEMVPPRHMRQLYAAALTNPKCKFVEFPEGSHMDTWIRGGERYWVILAEFMAAHAGSGQQDRVVGKEED